MQIAEHAQRGSWKLIGLLFIGWFVIILQPGQILGLGVLTDVTEGVISATLINAWAGLLIVVGGVILWYGGLSLKDVGLEWSKLPIALLAIAGLWLAYTAVQLLYAATVGDFSIHPDWTGGTATETLGMVLGYSLGNAPLEEITFRGFLFVQLYLLLTDDWWRENQAARVVAAMVGSSLPFALLHLVLVFAGEIPLWFVGAILVYSIALCVVYWWTGNLFIAIGIHGLANYPVPALAVHDEHTVLFQLGWLVPAAVLVIMWRRLSVADFQQL